MSIPISIEVTGPPAEEIASHIRNRIVNSAEAMLEHVSDAVWQQAAEMAPVESGALRNALVTNRSDVERDGNTLHVGVFALDWLGPTGPTPRGTIAAFLKAHPEYTSKAWYERQRRETQQKEAGRKAMLERFWDLKAKLDKIPTDVKRAQSWVDRSTNPDTIKRNEEIVRRHQKKMLKWEDELVDLQERLGFPEEKLYD